MVKRTLPHAALEMLSLGGGGRRAQYFGNAQAQYFGNARARRQLCTEIPLEYCIQVPTKPHVTQLKKVVSVILLYISCRFEWYSTVEWKFCMPEIKRYCTELEVFVDKTVCGLARAQTERGNTRGRATKKCDISCTLLSINLHFLVDLTHQCKVQFCLD